MGWKIGTLVATVLVALVGFATSQTARALSSYTGASGAETYYIGRTTHSGTTSQYACVDPDSSANGNAAWITLGSSNLNDDWEIHGSGGGDYMKVIRTNGTSVSVGDCAGTWDALVYGAGNYLDVSATPATTQFWEALATPTATAELTPTPSTNTAARGVRTGPSATML